MDNKLDQQYQTLLQTILDFGVEKKDRTGTGTKSIFGYTIRHNMKDGFPLLTTRQSAGNPRYGSETIKLAVACFLNKRRSDSRKIRFSAFLMI